MVTISKYTHLADAQKDMDRIITRGIEAVISHGGLGGVIGGNQPAFELQVYKEDLPQLEAIQEEILAEINAENQHACPSCGSRNYQQREDSRSLLTDFFSMLKEGRPSLNCVIHYTCNDCFCNFEIDHNC